MVVSGYTDDERSARLWGEFVGGVGDVGVVGFLLCRELGVCGWVLCGGGCGLGGVRLLFGGVVLGVGGGVGGRVTASRGGVELWFGGVGVFLCGVCFVRRVQQKKG
ncbi:hypothetical protein [Neisseria sp. P0018.S002]|uniref:hypothetical protein n=1 Tax=Neisseria sp. P0018.S002 TaxID=3436788 RepID=UPI003F7FE99F